MEFKETQKKKLGSNCGWASNKRLRVIYRNCFGSRWTWSVAINNTLQGNFNTEEEATTFYNEILGFENKLVNFWK